MLEFVLDFFLYSCKLCNLLEHCVIRSQVFAFFIQAFGREVSTSILSCACVRFQACITIQYYQIIHSKYLSMMKYTWTSRLHVFYGLLYLLEFPHSIHKIVPLHIIYTPNFSTTHLSLFVVPKIRPTPIPAGVSPVRDSHSRAPSPFIYVPISMLHSESAKLTVMLWWGRRPILRTFSLAISRAGRTRSMENNRLLSLGIMVAIFITLGFSAMSPRTDASTQITERSFNSTDIFCF